MANATTANPAMTGAAPIDADRIAPRRVVAFIIMVFGMFMSILDIQIVSASLSDIQAGLSASSTEVSWVQTAYLIAEVIAIPLSGFLSRALGTRLLFAISAAGFTFASLLCGFATSSEEMILWRAIQGFLGAGMIPTVFASAYTVFPRSKFYIVGPIIGLVATLAPTIGPTVGGLITDVMSWHWLFFINVIPGIIITVGVLALVDFDQPNFALLQRFDWWGLIFMAGFLGALEYVLEEGPQYEWLQDTSVAICAAVLLSAIGFFCRVFTAKEPIVDLRAFSDRNFAVGCLFQFSVGIGLYGLTYLYPRLPRLGARLQRSDDRRHHVRHRRHAVPVVADPRSPDAALRPAQHDRLRSGHLCVRHLPDDLYHPRLRFLGVASGRRCCARSA